MNRILIEPEINFPPTKQDEDTGSQAQYYLIAAAISYFILLVPSSIRFCVARRSQKWQADVGLSTLSIVVLGTITWVLCRLCMYIFLLVLMKIDKLSHKNINLYSKASTEYFEEFFICIFFVFLKSATHLKTRCYNAEDSDEIWQVFFQRAWFQELEITLSFIGIGCYIGVALFMTIVYNDFATFYLQMMVWSFVPGIICICWMTLVSLNYSGKPTIDQAGSKNYNFIRKRLIFWCIGKIARGMICLRFWWEGNDKFDFDWPTCVLCLLSNYFSEIFPIFLILDVVILKALFGTRERENLGSPLIEEDPLNKSVHSQDIPSTETGAQDTKTTPPSSNYRAIDFKLLRFIESSEIPNKKHGRSLGKITKAYYNANQVRVREIGTQEKQVSHYMFEEVVEEFSQFKLNNYQYIENIIGISKAKGRLYVISDWYNLNLLEYQKSFPVPGHADKLSLFLEVVKAVDQLHRAGMVHGHLTPSNILFDQRKNALLADYYFLALRKKMVYSGEYIMWSPYSAPEILGNERVPKFEMYSDIYSLGMILWEIFAGIEPFGGLPMDKLSEVVGKKNLRPKLSEDYPQDIVDLINSCWSDEILNRPASEKLIEIVEELIMEYD